MTAAAICFALAALNIPFIVMGVAGPLSYISIVACLVSGAYCLRYQA